MSAKQNESKTRLSYSITNKRTARTLEKPDKQETEESARVLKRV